LARIYTRTGDKGETGLLGGERVPKDSLRVQAYGNADELNSVIGLARALLKDREVDSVLENVQRDLFVVGADLAAPQEANGDGSRVTKDMVAFLERTIDKFQDELPPLTVFILPGGTQAGAILHFARSVARRAERSIVALSKAERVNENLIPYVNRLSDLLFVIARVINFREGTREVEWHSPK